VEGLLCGRGPLQVNSNHSKNENIGHQSPALLAERSLICIGPSVSPSHTEPSGWETPSAPIVALLTHTSHVFMLLGDPWEKMTSHFDVVSPARVIFTTTNSFFGSQQLKVRTILASRHQTSVLTPELTTQTKHCTSIGKEFDRRLHPLGSRRVASSA